MRIKCNTKMKQLTETYSIRLNKKQSETLQKLKDHFKMKQKKYTFTEAYNRIPYNEKEKFRTKAKRCWELQATTNFVTTSSAEAI